MKEGWKKKRRMKEEVKEEKEEEGEERGGEDDDNDDDARYLFQKVSNISKSTTDSKGRSDPAD